MSDRAVIKGHTITKSMHLDAPLAEVWAAVGEPAGIARWFSDEVDVDGTGVGATGTLTWEGYGTFPVEIVASTPPTSFAFRWGSQPGTELDEAESTTATFTLTDDGTGTSISVVESGFENLSGGTAYRRRHLEENRDGWDIEFDELAALFG